MLSFYLAMIDSEEDKNKFEAIWYTHRRFMMYKAMMMLNNDSMLAEDAVSEAFIRIIKNLDKIDKVDSGEARAYISKIVENTALDRRREQYKIKVEPFDNVEFSKELAVDFTTDMSMREMKSQIVDFINKMPPATRDALYYCFVYDMSEKKIAEILGVSYNTCRKRISRGKQMLREKFGREVL